MKMIKFCALLLLTMIAFISWSQTDIDPKDSMTNRMRLKAIDQEIELGKGTYESFFNRGVLNAALGDTNAAIKDYDLSISMNNTYVPTFINRGVIYQKLRKFDTAEKDFTKAIELDPKSAIAVNNRGYLYLEMGEDEKAIKDFNKSIKVDKTHTEAYMNKVDIYTRQRNKEMAMAACTELIEALPEDPKGYTTRSHVYIDFGDIANAMRDQDQAVEMSGFDPAYLIERSRMKDDIGDDIGSLADCDLAISKDPNVANFHFMRSRPLYDLQNYSEVIISCDRALELNPREYKAMVMKANVLDAYGSSDEAAILYERAISIAPEDYDAYVQLTILNYAQGKMDAAIATLERFLNDVGPQWRMLKMRGQLLGEMGKFELSLADFNQLVAMSPKDAQGYYLQGLVNDTLKNLQLACEQMIVADGLGSLEAHRYLRENCRSSMNAKLMKMEDLEEEAYHLEMKGDFKGAIVKYDDAISIVPDSARLYYNRGKAKRKMNDHLGAIADYKSGLGRNTHIMKVDFLVSMGVSYSLMNNDVEAKKAYRDAIKVDPTYAMSYYNLALIDAQNKKYTKAIELIETSLFYNPNYVLALIALGDCYVELEDYSQACSAFKRAETLGDTSVFGKRVRACRDAK